MDINLTDFINNNNLPKKGTKIVVAMSGGVDSSVAAAMMTRSQSNVIGITLKLYDEKKVAKSKTCCAGSDILDDSSPVNGAIIFAA